MGVGVLAIVVRMLSSLKCPGWVSAKPCHNSKLTYLTPFPPSSKGVDDAFNGKIPSLVNSRGSGFLKSFCGRWKLNHRVSSSDTRIPEEPLKAFYTNGVAVAFVCIPRRCKQEIQSW